MHLFRNWLRSRTSDRRLPVRRPQRAKQRSPQLYLEFLEDRLTPSTITWVNRGQLSDNFAAVWGGNAGLARSVVDTAINTWTNAVSNFNQPGGGNNINVSISMASSGGGNGGSTSITAYNGGWPTAASITLARGNDGHGSGYFLDPTPNDSREFLGSIVNPFSGMAQAGSPAAGLIDLYTVTLHELTHALGFVAGTRLQNIATDTGVLDTPGHPELGTLWVVHGPTITHLTTSDNNGTSDAHGPEHTAYINHMVTWQGRTLQGAEDLMNGGLGPSERRLIPTYVAQMLHDAYNYTIIPATSLPTFHAVLDPSTGKLLVRGRLDTASGDTLTLDTFSLFGTTFISTTVDLGSPVPGTDYPGPYTSAFFASSVSSIEIDTGPGISSVHLNHTTNVPITINSAGQAFAWLGTGGNAQGVKGSITLNNSASTTGVFINDSSDPSAHTTTIQDTGGGLGQIIGLSPASVTYHVSQLGGISLDTGTGSNTVNVYATGSIPMDVTGHSNSTTVRVGNGTLANIRDSVTITNPPFYTTVVVDDSTDSSTRTAAVNTWSFNNTYGQISGLTNSGAWIFFKYGDTNNVTVKTGSGTNTVNVLDVVRPLNLEGHSGTTTVNVGRSGSLQSIVSPVSITNPPAWTTLNVDDSADSATHNNVVVTAGSITGLAPATINYLQSDLRALNISTGTGSNTIFVPSTPNNVITFPHTALIGHSGATTVNVGNAGSLSGIQGALDVSNPPAGGYTALNVDDSADAALHNNVVLSESSLTGLAPAAISYSQSDLRSLYVRLGNTSDLSSGNIVFVANTPISGVPGGMMTTITTGTAVNQNDLVFVVATTGALIVNLQNNGTTAAAGVILGAGARTLDSIQSPVTVNTLTGWTGLALFDDQNVAGQNYTVTANTVSRSGRLMATYQVSNALFLYASRGANTINVQSTSQATVINAGWSDDTINVGDAGNTLDNLHGGNGGYLLLQINNPGSQIIFNDQGSAASRSYTFFTDTRNNPVLFVPGVNEFFFSGPLAALVLNGSSGSDTYNIETTFTATTINGGGGGNMFRISPVAEKLSNIVGPLTVNGGGNDTLEFFDANNPNSETYNFDSVPSNLTLTTVPVSVNFSGMGAVYLVTNGMSTVNDPSGTVIVDPVGGPP